MVNWYLFGFIAAFAYLLNLKRVEDPYAFTFIMYDILSYLLGLSLIIAIMFVCFQSLRERTKDFFIGLLGESSGYVRQLDIIENLELNAIIAKQNSRAEKTHCIKEKAVSDHIIERQENTIKTLRKTQKDAAAEYADDRRLWKNDKATMERQHSYYLEQLEAVAKERNDRDKQIHEVRKELESLTKHNAEMEDEMKGLKAKMQAKETKYKKEIEHVKFTYETSIDHLTAKYTCAQQEVASMQNALDAKDAQIDSLEKQLKASRLQEKRSADVKKIKKLDDEVADMMGWVAIVESDKMDLVFEKDALLARTVRLEEEKETDAKDAAVQLAYLHKEHMKKEKVSKGKVQKLRKETDQLKKDLVKGSEEHEEYEKWCFKTHIVPAGTNRDGSKSSTGVLEAMKDMPLVSSERAKEYEAIEIPDTTQSKESEKNEEIEEVTVVALDSKLVETQQSVKKVKPAEEIKTVDGMKTDEEIKTVEETDTVEEIKIVEEVKTVEETKPVEEIKTGDGIKNDEELKTVGEADAVKEIKIVKEIKTVKETKPVEETKTVEEAKTVEETKPVEEAKTVEEIRDVEKVTTVEDIKTVEKAKIIEETKPVEETKTLEETKSVQEAKMIKKAKAAGQVVAHKKKPTKVSAPAKVFNAPIAQMVEIPKVEANSDQAIEVKPFSFNDPLPIYNIPHTIDFFATTPNNPIRSDVVAKLEKALEVKPFSYGSHLRIYEQIPVGGPVIDSTKGSANLFVDVISTEGLEKVHEAAVIHSGGTTVDAKSVKPVEMTGFSSNNQPGLAVQSIEGDLVPMDIEKPDHLDVDVLKQHSLRVVRKTIVIHHRAESVEAGPVKRSGVRPFSLNDPPAVRLQAVDDNTMPMDIDRKGHLYVDVISNEGLDMVHDTVMEYRGGAEVDIEMVDVGNYTFQAVAVDTAGMDWLYDSP